MHTRAYLTACRKTISLSLCYHRSPPSIANTPLSLLPSYNARPHPEQKLPCYRDVFRHRRRLHHTKNPIPRRRAIRITILVRGRSSGSSVHVGRTRKSGQRVEEQEDVSFCGKFRLYSTVSCSVS